MLRVESIHLDLAGLLEDYLRGEVLLGWRILGVKWAHMTNHSVLFPHVILIAVLSVSDFKVIQDLLINSDFVVTLPRLYLFSRNLQVYFGTKRPEVLIKSLLATQWVTWIEGVEGLAVDLITAGDHL